MHPSLCLPIVTTTDFTRPDSTQLKRGDAARMALVYVQPGHNGFTRCIWGRLSGWLKTPSFRYLVSPRAPTALV
ncbi:hypothetical protein PUNSTDRAFT_119051 [Punctularia strigosozonata HHB-11173 SS5]|uniref:uncharacterized protein n=1 Tax=Punctularia strigosozonata (strain HHB-11173) TaxID=741275 RepID=UPI000441734B|nr:uncharacterized protein PUNSTDRAFT_119051 [Punctularia strigosozonata HHB-11173 SS5]EIN11817.1 hypothetical protein PUNSTDRAFT_119051 [Punctularia strigosozonata HHB-11173 SS5]